MKSSIILAAVLLTLTGCAATPAATPAVEPVAVATATPTPTATDSQDVSALQQVAAAATPAQKDTLYLAGVRATITTGTDAALIAIGHKTCDEFAAGVDTTTRVANIKAAGFLPADSLSIMLSAGIAYCHK